MATVRKAPGDRSGFQVRYYDVHGKRRTKTFRRKADAVAFRDEVGADVRSGEWVNPAGAQVLFADWYDEWQGTTLNLRPSTRARDEVYVRRYLLPTFGTVRLGAIDQAMVQAWVGHLAASGLAPATVVKAYQILGKILRRAVNRKMLSRTPCSDVELPEVPREEMRFLEPTELARLADAIDPRYRALVLLAGYGGLRAGELFALRSDRVDVLRARVEVAETVVEVGGVHHFGPPKTSAGRRTVPVPRFVAETLGAHLHGVERGALVFPAPLGGPVRASLFRRRFWLPAVRSVGLEPLRLHDLRHTAVALWIEAGASPNEIAARAGHRSVVTVLDRYGHRLESGEERVTDALDEMARNASRDVADVVSLR